MKEIRLCDDSELDFTLDLCKKYNTGIEIQGFYNPYIENKEWLLQKYTEKLNGFNKGRSYHAPFWDLCLGTKIVELQETMLKIY